MKVTSLRLFPRVFKSSRRTFADSENMLERIPKGSVCLVGVSPIKPSRLEGGQQEGLYKGKYFLYFNKEQGELFLGVRALDGSHYSYPDCTGNRGYQTLGQSLKSRPENNTQLYFLGFLGNFEIFLNRDTGELYKTGGVHYREPKHTLVIPQEAFTRLKSHLAI